MYKLNSTLGLALLFYTTITYSQEKDLENQPSNIPDIKPNIETILINTTLNKPQEGLSDLDSILENPNISKNYQLPNTLGTKASTHNNLEIPQIVIPKNEEKPKQINPEGMINIPLNSETTIYLNVEDLNNDNNERSGEIGIRTSF
ncbi:MAG: hypothetical protein KC550_04090 [Nanoarchaeota archaeon]|nr:hypothetical protein [Nanoarchaeota archaeon]